jgi:hypothetical protein
LLKIKERDETGSSMNRCDVLMDDNDLCMAAIGLFGSWGRALTAAGLTPPKPRALWTRERIVDAIQMMHQQGTSLKSSAVRKTQRSLHAAALRQFGSWRSALTASGMLSDKNVG